MSFSRDLSPDELREAVRAKYAAIARGESSGCGGSKSSCCKEDQADPVVDIIGKAYERVDGYLGEADMSLGCGIPTEHAALQSGQTVVDLGSGAGLDAFVARRAVGEEGRVVGVDFVPEMVEKAQSNARELGFQNVSFVEGEIEDLPLEAETVDVVLSNCVLNLVPDKERAFSEIYRVLRPGGHFCISDIVSDQSLPDAFRRSAELYAGCVAGALEETQYLNLIDTAGFVDLEIPARTRIEIPEEVLPTSLADTKRAVVSEGELWSITVRGKRPVATR